mgnify:CR=1 FL=1|jgi:hypothetical protein
MRKLLILGFLLAPSVALAAMAEEPVWDFVPSSGALIYGIPFTDAVGVTITCASEPKTYEIATPMAAEGGTMKDGVWTITLQVETDEGMKSFTLTGKREYVEDEMNDPHHTAILKVSKDSDFIHAIDIGKRLINPATKESIPLTNIFHERGHLEGYCSEISGWDGSE